MPIRFGSSIYCFLISIILIFALSPFDGTSKPLASRAEADSTLFPGPKIQKRALQIWKRYLEITLKKNEVSRWNSLYKSNISSLFEHYASTMSEIFKRNEAVINFVMVGACDGTNDRTISNLFLQNHHWRGVFIEPFTINFHDLTRFFGDRGLSSQRAYSLQGAVTDTCSCDKIKVRRPTFEESDPDAPHWIRRQIGAVVPPNKLNASISKGWMAEWVRCLTASDVMKDWTQHLLGSDRWKLLRPHILKIDTEGHDGHVRPLYLN